MKKRITDLFDDVPAEMLDEISTGRQKQKNYKKIAASILLGFICLLSGTAVYAAVRYPEQFRQFLDGAAYGNWSGLLLNQSYETRNEDYCLRVEDMLADGDVKILLISVEGLNEESREKLQQNDTVPSVQFYSAGGGSVSFCNQEGDKKYFLAEWETHGRACRIIYAETIDRIPDEDWLDRHEEDSLVLSLKIKSKGKKAVTVRPNRNEFPEGIKFSRIEIRRMGINVKGYSVKKTEEITGGEITNYFYPTVTAVLKDGRKIRLLDGNMGYEEDAADMDWPTGGGASSLSESSKSKKTKAEFSQNFRKILDLDEIACVIVNDTEYKIR